MKRERRLKGIKIRSKLIYETAKLPQYQNKDDSGADVCSAVNYSLKPHERKAIPTGIAVEVPYGFELQVRSRSGMALHDGIFVLNSPGTIDAGYRGEVMIILANMGDKPYTIKKGQRIAQLVLTRVEVARFLQVTKLKQTVRDQGGFGSTGK